MRLNTSLIGAFLGLSTIAANTFTATPAAAGPGGGNTGPASGYQALTRQDSLALRFTLEQRRTVQTVTVLGTVTGIAGSRPVFRFSVPADGSIRWWDGSGWTEIATAGTVPDSPVSMALYVPPDRERAYLAVGPRVIGEFGPVGMRAPVRLEGVRFEPQLPSGSRLEPVSARAWPNNAQPRVGEPELLSHSDSPVQMPNSAVTVPGPREERIRMSYPAHTDDSAGAGNRYVYSDDGGRSWTTDRSGNPMPSVPSVNLTKLSGGTLLATNYHTYLRTGSSTEASVETSVSTDGGASWTRRTGVLHTPQAMRPISTETDRPGTRLGGFVLVHGALEQPDGTLLQSAYGYYANDRTYRQLLLASTDGGRDWTVRSTVAAQGGGQGYAEGAFAHTADGALLAVMRTGDYRPMVAARSTDDGRTWDPPQVLRSGSGELPVTSIYPVLEPLPGGRLALLTGRPGLRLYTSRDGIRWSAPVSVDYRNSGNGTMVRTGNSLLVFGDRGANWARPAPAPYAIWAREVRLGSLS
ncbi:sialidase family protein [Sciscionella marina]|uniref:sialidase family protein n=1 Tax=Sciscionella marina TaxID=508770 RepID=UPI0003768A62|nr:sialidase family protein [Sciscionella marina]